MVRRYNSNNRENIQPKHNSDKCMVASTQRTLYIHLPISNRKQIANTTRHHMTTTTDRNKHSSLDIRMKQDKKPTQQHAAHTQVNTSKCSTLPEKFNQKSFQYGCERITTRKNENNNMQSISRDSTSLRNWLCYRRKQCHGFAGSELRRQSNNPLLPETAQLNCK